MIYYNENDPKSAAWLRELMAQGLLPQGHVDERSIEDVRPGDIDGYGQCHFFAGIGGWPYALQLAEWPEQQDVWTGSCPCQPFSQGGKGKGTADERHLWPAWLHLIAECRPSVIFGEQVASPGGLAWFDIVSTDFEAEDYACGAADLPACCAGYPHVRQRLFWVAEASGSMRFRRKRVWTPPTRMAPEFEGLVQSALRDAAPSGKYGLRDDGIHGAVALLRGFGNAIVPAVGAAFVNAYLEGSR